VVQIMAHSTRTVSTPRNVDRLAEGWTPEQITGWLKGGNELGLRAVGWETIYAFIYRAAQQAEQLWCYLTRHHKTSPPAPIETFARYHQGSRLHP
jgi:IS30 family transposase